MRARDWILAGTFVLGGLLILGVVLALNLRPRHGAVEEHDAGTRAPESVPLKALDPEPDDDDAGDDDVAPPPPSSIPSARRAPPSASIADAGAPRESGAPRTVVRASNLLIHPLGHEHYCIDFSSKKQVLHLHPCHGKKNQRWTAAEDIGGTVRLKNGEGACVVIGGTTAEGAPGLTLGSCGADARRFKHFEDHRLEDALTGQCVTTRRFEKGTNLSMEPCSASNPGQSWVMGE